MNVFFTCAMSVAPRGAPWTPPKGRKEKRRKNEREGSEREREEEERRSIREGKGR